MIFSWVVGRGGRCFFIKSLSEKKKQLLIDCIEDFSVFVRRKAILSKFFNIPNKNIIFRQVVGRVGRSFLIKSLSEKKKKLIS
jgi:hypothetical protein